MAIALLVAMLASLLFSIMHAVASISFRADQVVSGVAINYAGDCIRLFSVKMIFGKGQTDLIAPEDFPRFDVPLLRIFHLLDRCF